MERISKHYYLFKRIDSKDESGDNELKAALDATAVDIASKTGGVICKTDGNTKVTNAKIADAKSPTTITISAYTTKDDSIAVIASFDTDASWNQVKIEGYTLLDGCIAAPVGKDGYWTDTLATGQIMRIDSSGYIITDSGHKITELITESLNNNHLKADGYIDQWYDAYKGRIVEDNRRPAHITFSDYYDMCNKCGRMVVTVADFPSIDGKIFRAASLLFGKTPGQVLN